MLATSMSPDELMNKLDQDYPDNEYIKALIKHFDEREGIAENYQETAEQLHETLRDVYYVSREALAPFAANARLVNHGHFVKAQEAIAHLNKINVEQA